MIFGLLAVLGSAMLHPVVSSFAKRSASPLTLNFWGICLAGLIFASFYFEHAFWARVFEHWELVGASALFHLAYVSISFPLLAKHEFQVTYPLTRLAPIIILGGEIFWFGTEFSAFQIVGIIAVAVGALIFGMDRKIKRVRRSVWGAIFLITLFVAGFHLVDKKLLEVFSPSEMWAMVFFQAPFFLFLFWTQKKALREDLYNVKRVFFFTASMVGTWYLALFAMQYLDAAVVAALRNLSILFGVFLGAHLFDEGHKMLRYLAAGLIFGGAVMMVV